MITKPNRFRLSEIASRLLILASLVGFFMVADSAAGDRVGRAQKCRLVVGDKELISGGCPVAFDEVGGDDVGNNGVGGEILPFWARVISDDGKTGVAYYNGEAGSTHAHYDLGPVSKVGSCWRGANVEICYDNFTELDLGSEGDAVTEDPDRLIFASSKKEELGLTWREEIAGRKDSRRYILINMGINEVKVTKVVFNKKNNNDECVLKPHLGSETGYIVLINRTLSEVYNKVGVFYKEVAHLKLDTGEEAFLGNHYQCKQIIYLDVHTDINVYEWKITE